MTNWSLIAGRLYHSIYSLEKAKKYYEQAIKISKDPEQKIKAQGELAELFLIPSTAEGDLEAIKTFKEALETFKEHGLDNPFEEARLKTSLSNALRRQKYFTLARKYIEEAKNLFEEKVSLTEESHQLAYARCLNILGLIYYGEKNFEEALKYCNESKVIKGKFGDVEGVAESENAMGLILIEQGRLLSKSNRDEAINKIEEAIEYLNQARSKRIAIGDFRRTFMHYRNLGLAHGALAQLTKETLESKRYVQEAIKDFEEALNYLKMVKGIEPIGEILECKFRLGELHKQLGNNEEAIKFLSEVEVERQKLADWHNRARTLDLLRELVKEPLRESLNREILSIYAGVLSAKRKLREIKEAPIKFDNAKKILERTKEYFTQRGLSSETEKAKSLSQELEKKLSEIEVKPVEEEIKELVATLS